MAGDDEDRPEADTLPSPPDPRADDMVPCPRCDGCAFCRGTGFVSRYVAFLLGHSRGGGCQ